MNAEKEPGGGRDGVEEKGSAEEGVGDWRMWGRNQEMGKRGGMEWKESAEGDGGPAYLSCGSGGPVCIRTGWCSSWR